MNSLEILKKQVQFNCDRVDAENAQTFGLCIYLLRMWDYYRWWHGLDLSAQVPNEEILPWIGDVEEYWEGIEGCSFGDIQVNGQSFAPFQNNEINDALGQSDLVYSGGLSYGGIPMFFLAKLDRIEEARGFKVVIAGDELARGLYGFPAMLQDQTIFIRKEALRNFIWSRYDEWQFNKRDNPMGRAVAYYDFSEDPVLSLDRMVDRELNTLILHEVGEGLLKNDLGDTWGEMLIDFAHSRTEIIARAVKDLAADCLTTLPSLIEGNSASSIHFYFSNFSDMRKELYPELLEAYKTWVLSADISLLHKATENGSGKWRQIGEEILDLYKKNGKSAGELINNLVQ
jgi:uncharacterized protein DUF6866